jgi:hypothetical protein
MRVGCAAKLLSKTSLFLVLLLGTLPALAQKTDVVVMNNGDRITCEIKELRFGKLRCSTEYLGTIFIEWVGVRTIESAKTFEVELATGEKHYGPVEPGPEGHGVMVRGRHEVDPLDLTSVVSILPIKDTIWDRVDGGMDAGLNYTSAKDSREFSLNANLGYKGKKFRIQFNASAMLKQNQEDSKVNRIDLSGGYGYYLRNRWELFGLAKFQKNEELGLDYRLLAGGGIGRFLIHTDKNFLVGAVGLAVNKEKYYDQSGEHNHLEGILSLQYRRYVFGGSENEITSTLVFYPNLSVRRRYRIDFDTTFRHKFSNDFYISLSLYENFISHPPTPEDPKNDYGFTTSIGFTF